MQFAITRNATASVEAVFDAMTDHRAIAGYVWSVRRSTLDREGSPNGVGAVRRLVSFGTTFVERIVEYERPTHWAYSVLSGAPIRDHLGTIDLVEAGAGTQVTWRVQATPSIRGTDLLLIAPSRWLVDGLLNGAISVAERQ